MERDPVELVSPIDDEVTATVSPKFVDLIMRSTEDLLSGISDPDERERIRASIEAGIEDADIASAHRFYDPTDYRIKAVVGWTFRPDILKGDTDLPGANSFKEVNEDIRNAIDNTKMILYLTIHDHTISYREDGTIDLNIQYIAAIEKEIENNTTDLLQSTYERARQMQLEALISSLGEYENTIASPGGCGSSSVYGEGRSEQAAQDESEEISIYRGALERELLRLKAEARSVGYGAVWQYLRHRNRWAVAGSAGRTHTVFASAEAIGAVDPGSDLANDLRESGDAIEEAEIGTDSDDLQEYGAPPNTDANRVSPASVPGPSLDSNSAGLFVEDTAILRSQDVGTSPSDALVPSGRNPSDVAFAGADGAGVVDSLYLGAPAPGRAGAGRNTAGFGTWPTDEGGAR